MPGSFGWYAQVLPPHCLSLVASLIHLFTMIFLGGEPALCMKAEHFSAEICPSSTTVPVEFHQFRPKFGYLKTSNLLISLTIEFG